MNDMYKTIVNLGFIILASVGVCITVALGFFMIFNDNKTMGINFIDEQNGSDYVSEFIDGNNTDNEVLQQFENRYFIEASLFDNTNGNGVVLQEMRLNYFMSPNLNVADYYSTGMQYKHLDDLYVPEAFGSGSNGLWSNVDKVLSYYPYYNLFKLSGETHELDYDNNFNTYSTAVGLSANWGKSQTLLNRDTYYIVKIDGEPYRIKLQGKKDTRYDNSKWYNPFSWGSKGGSLINYNFCDIFADVMSGIKSNNLGTGTHFAVLDMSRYFTGIEKFIPGSMGGDWVPQKADIVKNYVAIKFHYSNNGAIRSSQSMFGIINNDPRYDIDESRYDTTYWQERINYTLTNKDLDLRYSSTYDGYFVSLSQDMKTLFKSMPRAEVTISISTTYNGKNIIGLDYNAFKDFRLKTLVLDGSGDFYFMTDCLFKSHIEAVKINNLINLLGLDGCGANPIVGGI